MKKYLWSLGGFVLVATTVATYQNDNPSRGTQNTLDSLYATLTQEQKHDLKYAVGALELANGLEANLFASEPMITNPTNIDIDHKGRVWVLEAYNYRPAITGNPTHSEGDRIMILEDTNGDGKADVSKIFYQGPEVAAPLGILVMGNRVLVSQSPYVWLFTDENGDDKADKKEIIFQGINGTQHDHGMHAFTFGPDGKLYFNFGNEGNQLLDGKGQPVLDQDGQPIDRKKYKQGMVFRCDQDFKNVEVLGHNFRNNYEVAVDSYGTMWQSDNDDDGNKGVRINYVMEYGNYGYTDELTGAGWRANRTNLEAEIPLRHWHLNDPGAVPNLLQTGAGSPTGMLIYEGDMLPEVFHNQMIHCDAGPNVVRSYPVEKNGAGFKASMVNVLYGKRNQWFRPSDVCIAPDGSLFAADWYDPGVGGHQAGDQNRGRIFRVAPANIAYKVPNTDFNSLQGALKAIQSPNVSVRYHAWNKIRSMGQSAEVELVKMYETATNPRMKARTLWLLSKLNNGSQYVEKALNDNNPDIRITAIRAARQITAKGVLPLTIENLSKMANDPDPQVRREVALAIRHNTDDLAADVWAQLASRHDGQDRWYLEALGVSADGQWDKFYSAWLKLAGANPIATAKGRDIVWRSRAAASVPLLASLAADKHVPLQDRLRYFRAFDFNPGATEKSNALLDIMKNNTDTDITKLSLRHLDPGFVKTSPVAQESLKKLLDITYGTNEYMELVQRFEPITESKRLLQLAIEKPMQKEGTDAVAQLLKMNQSALLWATINGKEAAKAQNVVTSLRSAGNVQSLDILKSVALDAKRSKALRMEASRALGGSSGGEDMVLSLLKEGKFMGDYKTAAVQGVSSSWRKAVRKEAASYLDAVPSKTGKKLPAISELANLVGNASNGQKVFANYCAVCHQVNGDGADFGPKLSEIGSKFGKDGQYMAIIYPSAGVSFGYEGFEVKMKDGSTTIGIVSSKTETDLIMKFPGGTTQNYKMSQVVSMKKMDESLMTAGLHEAMPQQDLVDLVEYLSTLKRK